MKKSIIAFIFMIFGLILPANADIMPVSSYIIEQTNYLERLLWKNQL